MDHPDEPVEFSRSPAGSVQEVPEKIISVVVEDEDDEPTGVLEKWSAEAWFYASADDVMMCEPEPADGDGY
jgi:hypothetical protein